MANQNQIIMHLKNFDIEIFVLIFYIFWDSFKSNMRINYFVEIFYECSLRKFMILNEMLSWLICLYSCKYRFINKLMKIHKYFFNTDCFCILLMYFYVKMVFCLWMHLLTRKSFKKYLKHNCVERIFLRTPLKVKKT